MEKQKAIHALVSGLVQGVYFRASTEQKAKSLGLVGWVRNCPDGSVECFAQGEAAAVDTFAAWLWEGPEAAKVSSVDIQDKPLENGLKDFAVRYS